MTPAIGLAELLLRPTRRPHRDAIAGLPRRGKMNMLPTHGKGTHMAFVGWTT